MPIWLSITILVVLAIAALIGGIVLIVRKHRAAGIIVIIVSIMLLAGAAAMGVNSILPLLTGAAQTEGALPDGETPVDEKTGPQTKPGTPADGPIYWEDLTGFNTWGAGEKVDWSKVKEPKSANQYLVAHGDLFADGKARIAVYANIAEARAALKDGTWKLNFVEVSNPDGTIKEYVIALNKRLGGDYLIPSALLDGSK